MNTDKVKTLAISEKVHRRLRMMAADEGVSLREVAERIFWGEAGVERAVSLIIGAYPVLGLEAHDVVEALDRCDSPESFREFLTRKG